MSSDRPDAASAGTYREVTRVAWPLVVSMLSYTLMSVADIFMVARLGTREVGAVGLAVTAVFTVVSFGWGLLGAVKVVVAQAFGAGQKGRTRDAAYQGVATALVLGLVALAIYPFARPILVLLGGKGVVLALGTDYLEIRLLGVWALFVSMAAFGYFQGLGDTRTPMRIQVVANLTNIGLDYVLIFGLGPVPAMGVRGAAIATVIALLLQVGIAVWFLVTAAPPRWPVRWKGLRRLLQLGAPMGMRFWLEVLSWSVFTALVARRGEAHLAAHVIAVRIVSVSFLPGHGIGEAACVLTGQAVGAGDAAAARRYARAATVLGLITMGACGVLFLLFGRPLVGAFNPTDDVLALGVTLLLWAAVFQLFDAVAMVKAGALNGAGDTRFVMFVGVGSAWFVLVPLGWLLCNHLNYGAPGAWAAITAYVVAQAAVLAARWEGPVAVQAGVEQAVKA